jgi:hypothetical protein
MSNANCVAVNTAIANHRSSHVRNSFYYFLITMSLIYENSDCSRPGNLTQKITGVFVSGEMLSLVNDMIDQLAIFTAEVKKVAREVRTEGKLGVQAEVGNVQSI